jgi:hypothetical protein
MPDIVANVLQYFFHMSIKSPFFKALQNTGGQKVLLAFAERKETEMRVSHLFG